MKDIFSVITLDPGTAERIKQHLNKIKESQLTSNEASSVISSAADEFNEFFKSYGEPSFIGNTFNRNDTAVSSLYNENLSSLGNDLSRLYSSLRAANSSLLTAFNYTNIVTREITNKATLSSSKVLDLSILNGFQKGTAIVAGDDFVDASKIDTSIGIETSQAEILEGSNAIALKRASAESILNPSVSISITPVMPIGSNGQVNTSPTPNNLERFYEGKFYAPIGQQESEGGALKFKYIVDPADIPAGPTNVTVTQNGKPIDSPDTNSSSSSANGIGFYAIVGSSEEDKNNLRLRMLDGNPDTYWQCEFVYKTEPLIDPSENNSIDLEPNP